MNTENIKSFLVSLGFEIDGDGAAKFDATIMGVTKAFINLGAVVEETALSVVAFTTKIASNLDDLYWASQRTGVTAVGIQSIEYAVSQAGGSAATARSSLENLAKFLRTDPGGEGFLNQLGVQTRDASGQVRTLETVFGELGKTLSAMPDSLAGEYASKMGIDENTLMAMRRGLGDYSAQYSSMAKAIGYNADQAAVSSNKFMTSVHAFDEMTGMVRDKIGSDLADGLADNIDHVRELILNNFPEIEKGITAAVKGILWLADVIEQVVYRLALAASGVIDWWTSLDKSTQTVIETLGALVVAWRLLNSAFAMSPIGWVVALATALSALIEDYAIWKDGGQSLIDWDKWEPAINSATDAIQSICDALLTLKDAAGGWQNVMEGISVFIAGAWLTKILGAFGKISGYPVPPWLAALTAYTAYVVSDKENIKASAEGSWHYTKRNIGDALRWLGFDTDFGRQPGTVKGANVQPDIPGADVPSQPIASPAVPQMPLVIREPDPVIPQKSEPEQYAQAIKIPQRGFLQTDSWQTRNEANTSLKNTNTLLGLIRTGIDRLHDAMASPVVEGNISEQVPYMLRGPSQSNTSVNVPQPSKGGAVLLGWMRPAMASLERMYNLPEGLLRSVAIAESGGDQFATSHAGAQGLFQLMPGTAKGLGLKGNDVFDPIKSADAAARYLGMLLRRNDGDLSKTLASYNWGLGNVEKYGMDLLPPETSEYIPRVQSNMPQDQSISGSIQQQNTYNIYGGNAYDIGREIEQRQTSANSRVLRRNQNGAG